MEDGSVKRMMRRVRFMPRAFNPSLLLALLLALALPSFLFPAAAQTLVSLEPSIRLQFDPPFDPTQSTYTVFIPLTTQSLQFTPTVEGGDATLRAKWNDLPEEEWQSGQPSPVLKTDRSFHLLTLTVVRPPLEDAVYIVNVVRQSVVGRNANLLAARFNPTKEQIAAGFTLEQMVRQMEPEKFSSQAYFYRVQLYANVSEFQFTGWVDTTATLSVQLLKPGASPVTAVLTHPSERSPILTVEHGETVQVFANVTAEDGENKKNYAFEVSREPPPPALSSSTGIGQSSSSTGADDGDVDPNPDPFEQYSSSSSSTAEASSSSSSAGVSLSTGVAVDPSSSSSSSTAADGTGASPSSSSTGGDGDFDPDPIEDSNSSTGPRPGTDMPGQIGAAEAARVDKTTFLLVPLSCLYLLLRPRFD